MKTMTQFEAQIPHPLREDLPKLLSIGCVGAPTVCVLFFVFIGKDRLKTAPVQVQIKHIGGRKGSWRQTGKEEFIHDSIARGANASRGRCCRMSSNDDAYARSCARYDHIQTVEEGTGRPSFRMRH